MKMKMKMRKEKDGMVLDPGQGAPVAMVEKGGHPSDAIATQSLGSC
jgi:hypothetical protein